jgi:hypothetical protein
MNTGNAISFCQNPPSRARIDDQRFAQQSLFRKPLIEDFTARRVSQTLPFCNGVTSLQEYGVGVLSRTGPRF